MIVLDEPTSALDVDSEQLITETLRTLPSDVLVVIIAHRVSTLRHCDSIVVLEDGVVTAAGTTDEVLKSNAFFRRAVESGVLPSSRIDSCQAVLQQIRHRMSNSRSMCIRVISRSSSRPTAIWYPNWTFRLRRAVSSWTAAHRLADLHQLEVAPSSILPSSALSATDSATP